MLSDSLSDFVTFSKEPSANLHQLLGEFETDLKRYAEKSWGYTDVYDLELSDSSCAPPTLQFDVKYPWTLHEARAVARIADELLPRANFYYGDARPKVYQLEENQAMLIIFDDIAPKVYGILDEEGILELERKLEKWSRLIGQSNRWLKWSLA